MPYLEALVKKMVLQSYL